MVCDHGGNDLDFIKLLDGFFFFLMENNSRSQKTSFHFASDTQFESLRFHETVTSEGYHPLRVDREQFQGFRQN